MEERGVGSCTSLGPGIRESSEQAREALQYKSALGSNRVIGYDEAVRQTETELFDRLQRIRAMTQSYKTGSEEWRRLLDDFFTDLGKGWYTHQEIVNLTNYMIFTLTKELSEFPADYLAIWKQEAIGPMTRVLDTFDTVEDIRQVFSSALYGVETRWKELRENRNNRNLVHSIKSYIEEHFGNPDLSLQLLSEECGVNKSYISRVFKDEFGENFVDYVAGIRIREAKRLMEGTELAIQDIAARVGYVHYFSFNRAFKKAVGLPPSDFRKGHTV
ncbi:AraC family transcriptional regulator [Paenibacillus filicis]|uniref:AraC family transcriptional regulator n=1 Tax=Paenibacillus gyeongsangnamensis TaxID=3388067 RepID=A0ABT4QJW2_9BACL|nr:AraC family transcriptional regulator [Paenibacillus filicis]MCZ8517163.1 AraC family transcriptional regulator [Paenibacillus filicis]